MENWKEEKVNAPKKGLWQRLAALAAAAALVLSLAGCSGLPSVPGGSADVVPNPSASAAAAVDTVDAPLEVHFIDVGQALSVLVECDGQFMLYDGGNVDDGSLVVSYLQDQGVEQLQLPHGKKLKEMVGHTPIEVLTGAALGIILGFAMPMV